VDKNLSTEAENIFNLSDKRDDPEFAEAFKKSAFKAQKDKSVPKQDPNESQFNNDVSKYLENAVEESMRLGEFISVCCLCDLMSKAEVIYISCFLNTYILLTLYLLFNIFYIIQI
jgi:hypothetical protein